MHPSPIMGFHVDAERTGLPAFSFEESLNAIHVEKGMLGAQKGRLANNLNFKFIPSEKKHVVKIL